MSFEKEGIKVILRGDPTLCRSPVGLRALSRTREVEFWAVILEEPAKLIDPDESQLEGVLD